jgi:pimeloyl-ACP methyl ester carboxylesterase
MPEPLEPFQVRVDDTAIADLRERLIHTRWPERETVDDWSQGVPLADARDLCAYWADGYDFGFADRINAFPQFRAVLDDLGIHFLHVRSPAPDALPLVLTHGWPGSVVEFLGVLGPLADTRAHGSDPADAFHVVAPSLPGFGWSDKPARSGWTVERIARAWDDLMAALGYDRYGAQGGDWGQRSPTASAGNGPSGSSASM